MNNIYIQESSTHEIGLILREKYISALNSEKAYSRKSRQTQIRKEALDSGLGLYYNISAQTFPPSPPLPPLPPSSSSLPHYIIYPPPPP